MRDEGPARSLELVRQQVDRVPEGLRAEIDRRRAPVPASISGASSFWITGAGGSEGPARALVERLLDGGRAARFVPLSPFAFEVSPPRGTVLIVFSQGLSPNARLALKRRASFAAAVLVTAVDPADDGDRAALVADFEAQGGFVWAHGPPREPPLLVRLEGPARAGLAAQLLATGIAGLPPPPASLPDAVRAVIDRGPLDGWDGSAPAVALVVGRLPAASTHGLAWKLLEGAGLPLPPTWDVLQVAHGPLQQLWHRPATLLALVVDPREEPLFDRLEEGLEPTRHRLLRLRATLPLPWASFEFDAAVGELVAQTLERYPRDLLDWPAKGRDGALYELGR